MNHKELVTTVSVRLGVTKSSVHAVLAEVVGQVHEVTGRGGAVVVSGLGDFMPKLQAPRAARNPRTGEPIRVKAKKVPAFKPAEAFKRAVL